MKKKMILWVGALAIALTCGFTSCKKSNMDTIKEIQECYQKSFAEMKNGNVEKGTKLMQKATSLINGLDQSTLTDEERAELAKIMSKQFVNEALGED